MRRASVEKSVYKKIISAMTMFAVATATAFSVPAGASVYSVEFDVTYMQTEARRMLSSLCILRISI